MPKIWLARRRLVAQRWLVVAEIATVAFAAGVIVGGQVYLAGGSTAVVSGSLERAAPTAKNIDIRLLTPPGFELAAADREIVRATRPLPRPTLAARLVSPVVSAGGPAAPSVHTALLYETGVAPAGLVSGNYPRAADDVVAPAGFLAGLRLRVGDSLRLTYRGAVSVRIVGSYDSLAAGSALFATPGEFGAGQPEALIVGPAGLRRDPPALGITSGASATATTIHQRLRVKLFTASPYREMPLRPLCTTTMARPRKFLRRTPNPFAPAIGIASRCVRVDRSGRAVRGRRRR